MKSVTTPFCTIHYPETVGSNNRPVTATLWEKNGSCRVYFKVLFDNAKPVDCGYFDAKTQMKSLASNPVSWARQISSEITVSASCKQPHEKTFNTGFGYYGTDADAARGFDGIE